MKTTLSRTIFGLAIVTVALVSACSAYAGTFPGANGKIAFHTDRDGNEEIYSMDPDGSNQTNLTNNPAYDVSASWSPDGTKIAFVSNRDGNYEIYTMNANGSGQTRITNNTVNDVQPSWSADGTKIAFVSDRSGDFEIWTMDTNGANAIRLTTSAGIDELPAWSPNGDKIAFSTLRDGNREIYKMDSNGANQTRLTNTPEQEHDPIWSPDGAKIAFGRGTGGSSNTVCSINAAGGGQICSAFNNIDEPAWSPDNTLIAVDGCCDYEIFTGDPAGNPSAQLTNNSANDQGPDWQAVVKSYARPKGATPTRLSLTPAYKQCTSANATHKAPLPYPSCVSPKPESSYVTVGTSDANGQVANSVGSARFDVRTTAPEDGLIAVSYTDVRCAGAGGGCSGGALSDYPVPLWFEAGFRVTDKGNAAGTTPGTVSNPGFALVRFAVPCTTTVSATIGSTCSANTTINTLIGAGAITAGARAIWQADGQVKLYDAGADGVASTTGDNTLFAVNGLFFP